MKITGDKISGKLESIDRFMDRYGFGINNIVNCVTKIFIKTHHYFFGDSSSGTNKNTFLNRYWTYIDKKDGLTCGLRIFPIIGIGLVWLKDKLQSEILARKDIHSEPKPAVDISEEDSIEQEGGEIVIKW